MVMPIALSPDAPSGFTGFGDDPNWSIKFGVYRGKEGGGPDWQSELKLARLTPATGDEEITQRLGRKPYEITMNLWLASTDDFDRLDAMQGKRATLRFIAGVTRRAGGSVQNILGVNYYVYPGTMLADLKGGEPQIDGSYEVTATFRRPYVAPAVFVPPVWPPAPYPGPRLLPDPVLFMTAPFSRNAAGAISPAVSGAMRSASMDGATVWRMLGAAHNWHPNPLFGTNTNNSPLWGGASGTRVTSRTDLVPSGTAIQIVCSGASSDQGYSSQTATGLGLAAGRTFMASAWAVGAGTLKVWTRMELDVGQANGAVTTYTLSGTPQRIVGSALAVPAGRTASHILLMALTTSAQAVTHWISRVQVIEGTYLPADLPDVDALGVLLAGDQFDGTAHASQSTRTAASLGTSLASMGSLYVRYSEDGVTINNAVLTAPGALGTYGSVGLSGGTLTFSTTRQLWILAAIAYPSLTAPQIATLNATTTPNLAWTM